jgi:hypothetical protein
MGLDTDRALLLTVIVTTVCWVAAAYLGPRTDLATLIQFYRKVHPFGPGWRYVQLHAGISKETAAMYSRRENIPLSLLGWLSGSVMIWSVLFCIGNFLYGRWGQAASLLTVFAASTAVLIRVVRLLWE